MAVDMFLKIDGIKGESKDATHPDEIQLQSYSFGANNAGSHAAGGGGGSGKVSFQDIHFTKGLDVASNALFHHVCSGKHIPSALLTCRKAGDKPLEYLKIKLTDLLVSTINWGASGGGDGTSEQVSINFTKIEITYFEQKKDGSGDNKGTTSWDLKTNAK